MKKILLLWLLGAAVNFALYLALAGGNTPRLTWRTWTLGVACYTPAILYTTLHRKRP